MTEYQVIADIESDSPPRLEQAKEGDILSYRYNGNSMALVMNLLDLVRIERPIASIRDMPIGTTFTAQMSQGSWDRLARVKTGVGGVGEQDGVFCFRNNCMYDYSDIIATTVRDVVNPPKMDGAMP